MSDPLPDENGYISPTEKGAFPKCTQRRRLRLGAKAIEDAAIKRFEQHKEPLTVKYIAKEFGQTQHRARRRLNELKKKGILFIPKGINHRPQWYFPACLESKVYARLAELAGKGTFKPIGVNRLEPKNEEMTYAAAFDVLEENFVDLLAGKPLQIHNLQFVTSIPSGYYDELDDIKPKSEKNKGKVIHEIIGKTTATFTIYPSGTVYVVIDNSRVPFDFQTEDDHTRLFSYLGSVRHELARRINDKRERVIPSLENWYFTRIDRNVDVPVDHSWHFNAYNFQVKHLDFILKVYIKEMGKDTVKRFETFQGFKEKRLPEVIRDHLNPHAVSLRIEEKVESLTLQVDKLTTLLSNALNGQPQKQDSSVQNTVPKPDSVFPSREGYLG